MAQETTTLVCKVTPNARKSECMGWGADERGRKLLLVKLAAPAQEGKANKELVRFLAELLGCAKSDVILLRGDTSRTKSLQVPAKALDRLP
ncbi:hypothetical protein DES53_101535 [Roseimicrobium gellanilyticum]|uniref:UPF0235 protein DES53_101535 n=1 Tax=Roseimicrobium gellanilyticum TaxID=748857 RepID=A0A366HTX4_9BACT|nr:DUF167 domain-containing protein [Roseimicrobium gellanilyticum]RBP47736.1 hypothetical protein DES53_101535 [Roseimicrobium gellanilyticum]